MNPSNRLRLVDYLGHVLDAIDRCQRYVAGMDEAAFLGDVKTQDAVIRTFEIIGEASNNIQKRYPEFVRQHPEVPFTLAIGMRNVLAHAYFQVDLRAVWRTIQGDLPGLQRTIHALVGALRHQQ